MKFPYYGREILEDTTITSYMVINGYLLFVNHSNGNLTLS